MNISKYDYKYLNSYSGMLPMWPNKEPSDNNIHKLSS